MKTNKNSKSSSILTSLRVQRTALQAELDRLNDCVRETRNVKNPFSNNAERIKTIEKKIERNKCNNKRKYRTEKRNFQT